MRVMTEEMRHGWQMSYLLCSHFGDEGKREAAKLLERRADEGERLLGSFNELVDNWLDFFTYTQFIDRDGKFQLTMLSVSAFDPLSRSMNPMLKEESFHLGTGNNGLLRIVKAGKMPPEVIQRFFYKWIPTAFDLFGTDNSSSAHWAYVWGLKGRYDERESPTNGAAEPDKSKLNEIARNLYRQEIVKLVERLNMFIPERERQLKVPDLKLNRRIGTYAHQKFAVDGQSCRRAACQRRAHPHARPGAGRAGHLQSVRRSEGARFPVGRSPAGNARSRPEPGRVRGTQLPPARHPATGSEAADPAAGNSFGSPVAVRETAPRGRRGSDTLARAIDDR